MTNMASPLPVGLNSETAMTLSQSMDSVNTTPEEEVRTLFVSGLPMDAKPRELYLLFRAYKGYESALLKIMGKAAAKSNIGYEGSLLKVTGKNGKTTSPLNPVGFVTFNSRCAAEGAKQDLQGVKFDPDLPQTLRLEFAKSNTKVTKPKQQSPQPAATHPTFIHQFNGQIPIGNFQSPEELGAAFFPGIPETWAAHPLMQASYAELTPTAAAMHHPTLIQHPALAQVPLRHMHPALAMTGHPTAAIPHPHMAASPILGGSLANGAGSPVSAMGAASAHTPSSTLFVTNLGLFCSEQELKDLFSSFPGFSRLRMHNKGNAPMAFVEYQDTRHAAETMVRLQGFMLLSSERGGMRIEFSKHKIGELFPMM